MPYKDYQSLYGIVLRLLPVAVRVDAQAKAVHAMNRLRSRVMAVAIVVVWSLIAAVVGWWAWKARHG